MSDPAQPPQPPQAVPSVAAAPVPPAVDAEDRLRHRLTLLAGAALAGAGALITGLLVTDPHGNALHIWIHVALTALGLGVLSMAWSGRDRPAATLLVWGMWSLCTLVALTNGGVRGPNLLNYPVLIIFSGWLLGLRATLALSLASAAVMLAMVAADGRWPIPPADFSNKTAYAVYLLAITGATAALTLLSRRSWQQRLARERQVSAALGQREQELRQLNLAVEQSPESVLITGLDGRIEYVNECLLRRSGYRRDELLGQPAALLDAPGLPASAQADRARALQDGQPWTGEVLSRRKDGSEYTESAWMAPIRQADGRVTHHLTIRQDLSARLEAEERIRRLAWYDPLTGLPNRQRLMQRLDELQAEDLPRRRPLVLLLLNLDRFKNVNEARGQDSGDALLRAVVTRLQPELPEESLFARIGADEFALAWLPGTDDATQAHHEALAQAQALQAALRQPLALGPQEQVQVTASLGLALGAAGEADSAAELLRRATTALHRAKSIGAGEVAFFESAMGEAAQRRFRIERELREALARGELQLYLQPQVDAQGGWTGAEALVRWLHPQHGMVPPGVFVPVAEETDLIIDLGRWVFQEGCRLVAQEAAQGRSLRLSINLSPRQFRQPDFVDWFRELLASTGADPTQLTLEVTEGLVIDDVDAVVARMHALSAMGVHFSIDDFGTGYSALAYLKRLPIDELKIDKTFVQDAPRHGDDAVLVETILSVARHMRLQVVAEGVETPEQAAFLAARAADVVYQGYLFGRPAPAQDWLQRRASGTLDFPVTQALAA